MIRDMVRLQEETQGHWLSLEWESGRDNGPLTMCVHSSMPPRFIGHCTMAELHDQYQHWHLMNCGGMFPANITMFLSVLQTWRGVLRRRKIRRQAHGAVCARLDWQRGHAGTEPEWKEVQKALEVHVQRVFADRYTHAKQNNLAMLSTTQRHYLAGRLLKLDLDGMGGAKFRCPRLGANQAFDGLWKPTLRLARVLIHGLVEIYFCHFGSPSLAAQTCSHQPGTPPR